MTTQGQTITSSDFETGRPLVLRGGTVLTMDGARTVLHDGDVLELGALRFRLLATPGHSPGCMVALEETVGEAFVGDLIFAQGIGRTDFPRSDHGAMMRSLERLFAEVPRDARIHPGHGPWGMTLAEAEPYARMFM